MPLQKRVSELPAVPQVAATDLLIVSSSNATKRCTVQQIGAYFAANGVAGPQGPQGPSGASNWSEIAGKPSTFPPATHQHVVGDVTGLQSALDGKQPTGSYVLTTDARLSDAREWSAATVSQADAEAGVLTSRAAFTPQRVFQAIAAWWNGSAAAAKLGGIAANATANQTDAYLLDRSHHTGQQTASTISDFTSAVVAAAPPTTNASLLTSGTLPDARLSSNIARTSDVSGAVAALVNAAPASLDTLKELADALGNDASFSATVTNALAAKAPLASPTFTGTVSGVTKAMVGLGNVPNVDATARANHTGTQAWSTIVSTPTTLAGYGITDGVTTSDSRLSDARTPTAHTQAWSTITSTPTSLSGYGITDAVASNDSRLTDSRTPTDGSVTSAKLAAGAVGTSALADSAVQTAKLANSSVTVAKISATGTASGTTFLAGDGAWKTAGSTNASDLTSGTLGLPRLPARARAAINIFNWSSFR